MRLSPVLTTRYMFCSEFWLLNSLDVWRKNTLLFPWPIFKLTLNKIELGSQNFGELGTGFRRQDFWDNQRELWLVDGFQRQTQTIPEILVPKAGTQSPNVSGGLLNGHQ